MSRQARENEILKQLNNHWNPDQSIQQLEQEMDELDLTAYGGPEEVRRLREMLAKQDEQAYQDAQDELHPGRRAKRELAEELIPDQEQRLKAAFDKLNNWERFQQGFGNAFSEGRVDHQKAFWNARETQDLNIEAPRVEQFLGTNPSLTRLRDLIGSTGIENNKTLAKLPAWLRPWSNPADRASREAAGLGLSEDGYARAGQLLGTAAGDINQDRFRSLWWLLNAPQAVTSVTQEAALSHTVPSLYASDKIVDANGKELTLESKNYKELMDRDLIGLTPEGEPVLKSGVNRVAASELDNKGKIALSKRRYRPGNVDLLGLPSAVAINAGVGLLNPLGGSNGYSAVFESEDDPSRTSNVIGEVAAKYILGRTGQMLPWDEFKKVRPDVSKDEYMRYKAFKYDKEADFDITDGDFTIPTGVLKGTMDGIHGPEIQFLGRSMPALTTMLPVLGAGIGTTLGAKWQPQKFDAWDQEQAELKRMKDEKILKIKDDALKGPTQKMQEIRQVNIEAKDAYQNLIKQKGPDYMREYRGINRVRNGVVSGLAGYGASLGAGLLLENERKRRNQAENERSQQL